MTRAVARIAAALAILAAAFLARQNLQLKRQLAAAATPKAAHDPAHETNDRRLAEMALTGKCRPYFEDAATPVRPLDVSIYFSLQQDCPSCIQELIRQWNAARGFTVKGFTSVNGTIEEQMLAGFGAVFPVQRVDRMQETLSAAGLTFTPAVVVSDPTTGRILLTHAPLVSEKSDATVAKRLQALSVPCAAS